jgi:hypothetical protein
VARSRRKIGRKARAAHPDRRVPGRNFRLERAAGAGGGFPRRFVRGSGPHRVRMARLAVASDRTALDRTVPGLASSPVTCDGPGGYLRRTWRVPRRPVRVTGGGQIWTSPAQSQPRGQGGGPAQRAAEPAHLSAPRSGWVRVAASHRAAAVVSSARPTVTRQRIKRGLLGCPERPACTDGS